MSPFGSMHTTLPDSASTLVWISSMSCFVLPAPLAPMINLTIRNHSFVFGGFHLYTAYHNNREIAMKKK